MSVGKEGLRGTECISPTTDNTMHVSLEGDHIPVCPIGNYLHDKTNVLFDIQTVLENIKCGQLPGGNRSIC